jgi:hypothetical protein
VACPQGHAEAQDRIAQCVREIEMIADTFGYDPYEWLASFHDGVDLATLPQNDTATNECFFPNCNCPGRAECHHEKHSFPSETPPQPPEVVLVVDSPNNRMLAAAPSPSSQEERK